MKTTLYYKRHCQCDLCLKAAPIARNIQALGGEIGIAKDTNLFPHFEELKHPILETDDNIYYGQDCIDILIKMGGEILDRKEVEAQNKNKKESD